MLFKPLWMLHIQLEVTIMTVVTVDFCKRIRALYVNIVESEWLSIPQSSWHTWLPAVKKQSGPRVLMPRTSSGKCRSHGQMSACLPRHSLKWAWLTPASSRCLINSYWVNKLAFSEIALAIVLFIIYAIAWSPKANHYKSVFINFALYSWDIILSG